MSNDNNNHSTPSSELNRIIKNGFEPVRADNISKDVGTTNVPTVVTTFDLDDDSRDIEIDNGNNYGDKETGISVKRTNLNSVYGSIYSKSADASSPAKSNSKSKSRKPANYDSKASKARTTMKEYGYKQNTAKGLTFFKVVGRIFAVLLTLIIFVAVAAYLLAFTIAHGPSETARNALVLNAKQASATKFIPELVLSKKTVDSILEQSQEKTVATISYDEYIKKQESENTDTKGDDTTTEDDKWASSTDGVLLETIHGSTYKAYILLIKDPSKVFVATSSNYVNAKYGMTLFDCAEKYNCLCAINGGEFTDTNGMGSGATPLGLTYAKGSVVWEDSHTDRTFIGFDNNNKLIVSEGMTKEKATELGIRDAVSFKTENVLIDSTNGTVKINYFDSDTSTAQRTAIGQCADGTVIFLVTDGRSTSSLGATKNDVINMMIEHGAVTAAMLDGGSSSMMYYRDYAAKYNMDTSILDEYQKQGMVNKFKAFTKPRYIPTYFAVSCD